MTDLKNRPSLNDVQNMTPEQVADLPLAQIAALKDDLAELKSKASAIDNIINAAMEDRFGKRARQEQQTGTVWLTDEDALMVKVELPKRVEWDQAQLADLANLICNDWGDDPGEYLRIKYEVSESAFKAWPKGLQDLVEPARTVKPGKPKFTIQKKEEG